MEIKQERCTKNKNKEFFYLHVIQNQSLPMKINAITIAFMMQQYKQMLTPIPLTT